MTIKRGNVRPKTKPAMMDQMKMIVPSYDSRMKKKQGILACSPNPAYDGVLRMKRRLEAWKKTLTLLISIKWNSSTRIFWDLTSTRLVVNGARLNWRYLFSWRMYTDCSTLSRWVKFLWRISWRKSVNLALSVRFPVLRGVWGYLKSKIQIQQYYHWSIYLTFRRSWQRAVTLKVYGV